MLHPVFNNLSEFLLIFVLQPVHLFKRLRIMSIPLLHVLLLLYIFNLKQLLRLLPNFLRLGSIFIFNFLQNMGVMCMKFSYPLVEYPRLVLHQFEQILVPY